MFRNRLRAGSGLSLRQSRHFLRRSTVLSRSSPEVCFERCGGGQSEHARGPAPLAFTSSRIREITCDHAIAECQCFYDLSGGHRHAVTSFGRQRSQTVFMTNSAGAAIPIDKGHRGTAGDDHPKLTDANDRYRAAQSGNSCVRYKRVGCRTKGRFCDKSFCTFSPSRLDAQVRDPVPSFASVRFGGIWLVCAKKSIGPRFHGGGHRDRAYRNPIRFQLYG
jgi:hypothetical protein